LPKAHHAGGCKLPRPAAAAAAEAARAAAEPDRLLFPFAVIGTRELLDTLPPHEAAHGALLADLADVLRGAPAPDAEAELLPPPEELRASELRVLRYLPTNLTRPEIARELLRLDQHGQHPHTQYLLEARCARSLLPRQTRTRVAPPLNRAPLEIPVARRIT